MRPIRVLELRSVRGTGGGPEKTILLGAARTDPARFAVTVCYLRDRRDEEFHIDARAAELPVDYVELVERHSLDPSIWTALRALVRERHIDIVHAHEYKTDVLAWMLAKVEPVIALATAHGWTGHSWRERWLYYPLDARILRRFPKVIAVSNQIRSHLVRHGSHPDHVVTVLNGIDHGQFRREPARERTVRAQLHLRDDDRVIGTVGRLEPQKRFDLLIDAVAQLIARWPDVKILIAGEGSLREALTNQIARLGLESTVRLLGQQPDIVGLHHAFDLFVQSSDYEGTPNAVLEAMALETPIVATDAGGTAELVRDGVDGLVIPRGRADSLAAAIDRALGDPYASKHRAGSARQRVETVLSFDTRMATLEAIYTDLFEQRMNSSATPVPART